MNVFVTGATGFLGTNLVKRLVQEHHHVYILVLSEMKAQSLLKKMDSKYRNQS
jgi:nucleoside-diphosphate-sugar epimerase